MSRLLQFSAIILLIGAFVPLLEFFDTWDAAGLSNDTEFAVYSLIFALCLVVLVCSLVSLSALKIQFATTRVPRIDQRGRSLDADYIGIFAVPPLIVPPLRI